ARGQATDQRTDVFSFGCVLYECVTGSKAFDAPSVVERMNKVINVDPPPLVERAPNVPQDLIRVVRKCLAKDPDERYQSMKELAIDLRDVRRQLETRSGDKPSGVSNSSDLARGDKPSGLSNNLSGEGFDTPTGVSPRDGVSPHGGVSARDGVFPRLAWAVVALAVV